MSDFDKYFTKPERYYHPKLNLWKSYLDRGFASKFEICQERDGLTFRPTIMFMHFYENGKEIYCDKELWDPDLNRWCLDKGIRAKNPDNESLRFSFILILLW